MGCRHLKGVGSWEIRAGRPASGAKAGVVSLLESRHFPGHFGSLDPLGDPKTLLEVCMVKTVFSSVLNFCLLRCLDSCPNGIKAVMSETAAKSGPGTSVP